MQGVELVQLIEQRRPGGRGRCRSCSRRGRLLLLEVVDALVLLILLLCLPGRFLRHMTARDISTTAYRRRAEQRPSPPEHNCLLRLTSRLCRVVLRAFGQGQAEATMISG